MNQQSLKLAIIRQVIACEDENVLNALKDLLSNFAPNTQAVNDEMVAALLQTQKTSPSPTSEQDLSDLQQSIDEIFG